MNCFKMRCEDCKKQLKRKPIKEAVKDKRWWKEELKEFGWANLLIILSVILIFSGFYFEYGDKVRNPCEWCKIHISGEEEYEFTCSEIIEIAKENPGTLNGFVKYSEYGNFENLSVG